MMWLKNKRLVLVSPDDYKKGEEAGRQHFETYKEDINQIVAEEAKTKDARKDELQEQQKTLQHDVDQLEEDRKELENAWKKEEDKLGETITEIDLKRQRTLIRGYTFKIAVFLLVEVLFTATIMEFALGISRFEAIVAAIGYPGLSSLILKIIFDNLQSKNYLVLAIFIPSQLAMLGVLAVFAYLRADATASAIPDVDIDFLRFAFIGLVIVLSLVLGYLFWKREPIKTRFGPILDIFEKKQKLEDRLNDLHTQLDIVNNQLSGLNEEFEKNKNLRIDSYKAGYRKGVRPVKRELEAQLTTLRAELQNLQAQLDGADELCRRIKEARQAAYETGFQKGVAIGKRREKLLKIILFWRKS